MAVRIIIAAIQSELVRTLNKEMAKLSAVDAVIQVMRVADVEAKINKGHNNVLLVDLDSTPDLLRMNQIKLRNQIYIISFSKNGAYAYTSLRSGGDEFLLRPAIATPNSTQGFIDSMARNVNNFAKKQKAPAMRELNKMVTKHDKQKILVIASSTGGTNALEELLKKLPADIPPTVVVQHMSSGFTKLFAERLNASHRQTVKEAETGDYLMRGTLLLAPADRHIKLIRREGKLAVECFLGLKMHGVMPAADILFESVAELVKAEAVGVILTGMGADGARGLMLMKNAGAKTIGQDEASCVVYGMPKVAKDLGAINYELPLNKIADKIMELIKQ
ncbi:MAG: CheB methylesterase domain-containing protein [Defluviitaleaceae bacterium]|nr:CheB methylesterase domain-containing protein [Defluviitaleaceae bacterium]MCL2240340.1 CheB methylesterase domain-containing protein [Defluviitaleaceae bacterium]